MVGTSTSQDKATYQDLINQKAPSSPASSWKFYSDSVHALVSGINRSMREEGFASDSFQLKAMKELARKATSAAEIEVISKALTPDGQRIFGEYMEESMRRSTDLRRGSFTMSGG